MEVTIMLEVKYSRDGIEDLRIFKSWDEFDEWLERETLLCLDALIVRTRES